VTALGAKAFLQAAPNDRAAAKALAFVTGRVRDEGFTKLAEGGVGTYVASAVLSALAASEDRAYADEIRAAIEWLRTNQWDQGEGLTAEQDWFGGAGYGRGKRPDLSNTQLMLDALHDAGVSPDDPAVQKALAFVSRAQNLKSTNASPWAATGSGDGGFVYSPANGGESFASEKAGEGRYGELLPAGQPRSLRSYGSMTYAGFKSLLYAGLSRDDERVKAAYDWVRRHYTFEENPGLGQDGLYYYYHAMARALLAAQQPTITVLAADGSSKDRNWREDLVAALVARQRPDGTWVNSSERWEESQADLVTIYAVLALEEALKPVLQME
jgi:squalene-hopene/tetraprenyl-beta-curcumene cyclase